MYSNTSLGFLESTSDSNYPQSGQCHRNSVLTADRIHLVIWKGVSWSIQKTQQYTAFCKEIYTLYISSRVKEDPILQLLLKLHMNTKQSYDCQGFPISQSSGYIYMLGSQVNCQCLMAFIQHSMYCDLHIKKTCQGSCLQEQQLICQEDKTCVLWVCDDSQLFYSTPITYSSSIV